MGATFRQRGKSSWLITVHHKGRKEFRTIHGTKADAQQFVNAIRAEELLGTNVIETLRTARTAVITPTPEAIPYPTLRDALPPFLDRLVALGGDIRQATAEKYRDRCAAWVYPHQLADGRLIGDLPIDQITRKMLGAVILKTREAGKSTAVREQIRNPIKKFFADLIETHGYPGVNPAADLRHFMGKSPSKKARKRVVPFQPEELPQLMRTIEVGYPRWFAFTMVGILGGLRWGEIAALQTPDIDFRRSLIHVSRTVSGKTRRIEHTKDHESRDVALTPALAAILRAQIEAASLDGQVHGWTPEQRRLVFPNERGLVRRHAPFTEVWGSMVRKAGLPHRGFHSTRHTFATLHLESGADIRWVSEQMGHASIAITADTYGHVRPQNHQAAAVKLDRLLGLSSS